MENSYVSYLAVRIPRYRLVNNRNTDEVDFIFMFFSGIGYYNGFIYLDIVKLKVDRF
jgi:hypothetical protein